MRGTKQQTISRNDEIAFLAREHHDGLLLSWKINSGLSKGVSVYRIRSYILYFFDNFLEPHFTDEEQNLYRLLNPEHKDRREAELQHAALRVRIEYFRADYKMTDGLLKDFADVLCNHIRFEEKILFGVIESEADPVALRCMAKKSKNILKIDNGWKDQFWLQ